MSISVTCQCGKTFGVDDRHAGRMGRCKACGASVRIPPAPVDVPVSVAPDEAPSNDDALAAMIPPDVSPAIFAPDPPAALIASCALVMPLDVRLVAPQAVPPEPWYFGAIVSVAWISLVIGLSASMIGVLFGLNMLANVHGESDGYAAAFVFLQSLAAAWVAVLTSAPMFLVVDAARNLRAIRIRVTA